MSDWNSILPFISSLGLINMIIPTCTFKQIKQIKHIKYSLNKCVSLYKLSKSMTALNHARISFFEFIGCSCLTISCGSVKNIHQDLYPHLSRGKLGDSRYSVVLYTVVLIYIYVVIHCARAILLLYVKNLGYLCYLCCL